MCSCPVCRSICLVQIQFRGHSMGLKVKKIVSYHTLKYFTALNRSICFPIEEVCLQNEISGWWSHIHSSFLENLFKQKCLWSSHLG